MPIAVGLLMASEQLQADLARTLIIGELSLDGIVLHTNGVLPMAALARAQGFKTLFVPASDAPEAALVMHLQGMQPIAPYRPLDNFKPTDAPAYAVDFAEVRGQEHVKRALEVAAAGQHNVFMLWTKSHTLHRSNIRFVHLTLCRSPRNPTVNQAVTF